MLTIEGKEKLVNLCQKLISIKSYSGDEKLLVDELKEYFTKEGFDKVSIDKYGNIIGVIKGNKEGPKILFDSHIDTVPVNDEEKWTVPPFAGEIQDEKIYGRGASDMKGALSSAIIAAINFKEDTKKDFAGEIIISGVVHEECFEGVGAKAICDEVKPDYVIIGEASELNLKIGQRGRGEILLETFGKPAHSANPEKGINAIYSMNKLIEEIRKLPVANHEILGRGILEVTDIKSSPYPGASVVPEYCSATIDRRLLTGETRESVLKPIEDLVLKLEKEDEKFKAKVSFSVGEEMCFTGNKIAGERFFPGWLLDKEDEFVKLALKGLVESGLNPKITHYSFCTNGSHYAGEANVKTIGFGPSRENLAHVVDEYIEIEQLVKACQGYYGIMKSILINSKKEI
jgi:putative selenium metabolism hydrolase